MNPSNNRKNRIKPTKVTKTKAEAVKPIIDEPETPTESSGLPLDSITSPGMLRDEVFKEAAEALEQPEEGTPKQPEEGTQPPEDVDLDAEIADETTVPVEQLERSQDEALYDAEFNKALDQSVNNRGRSQAEQDAFMSGYQARQAGIKFRTALEVFMSSQGGSQE